MKSIYTLISGFVFFTAIGLTSAQESHTTSIITSSPNSPVFNINNEENIYNDPYNILEQITERLSGDSDISIEKRDQADTLASILETVNNSGIIIDVLHEIAGSDEEIDRLANITIDILEGRGSSAIAGLNISVNSSELLHKVLDSGIINSTLNVLTLDVPNRNFLADCVGGILKRQVWVAKLLSELGNGHDLTLDYVAYLVKHTKSKASNYNQVLNEWKSVNIDSRADSSDDQYSGSAQEFLSNVANTVLNSQLADSSIDTILKALNESEIVPSIVLQVINDTSIKEMVEKLVSRVYNSGVLDGVDLNSYFVYAKDANILSNGLQVALTDKTYAPALARIFQRMENNGVYQQIQWNLYGDKKK